MKLFRPVAERREYARHLKSAFPSGYWVEDHEGEAEVAEVPGCEPGGSGFESRTPPHLTVIAAQTPMGARIDAVGTVADEIRQFGAALEREVRDRDAALGGVLDSMDVRWALRDMRCRVEGIASSLDLTRVEPVRVSRFLLATRKLGIDGINSAVGPDEVADALSRAVDHLQDFVAAHVAGTKVRHTTS